MPRDRHLRFDSAPWRMSYKKQKEEWLKAHPNATADDAYEAGYLQSTENWVHQRR